MRVLLLLLTVATLCLAWVPFLHTREQVRDCLFSHHINVNEDDCVSKQELQRAYVAAQLTPFQLSALPSVEKLMRDCQPKHSRDDCISKQDLEMSMLSSAQQLTCLTTWSHVHWFHQWVCENVQQNQLEHDS
jgi:hypothetical protein